MTDIDMRPGELRAMLATIDALTTENATLKATLEGYRQALEAVEGASVVSEPTPLSAEELAWLSNSETFRDPDARWDTAWLRSALATIDAQATEIADYRAVIDTYPWGPDEVALKGALEEVRQFAHVGATTPDVGQLKALLSRIEVLAGKEVQGD